MGPRIAVAKPVLRRSKSITVGHTTRPAIEPPVVEQAQVTLRQLAIPRRDEVRSPRRNRCMQISSP
jgi:hypothetical protein